MQRKLADLYSHTENQTENPFAFSELENIVFETLKTYSNVHRGSGPFSKITTKHYEEARNVVLEYLGLNPGRYVVIFCSPRSARKLSGNLKKGSYYILTGEDFGLSLGIRALAVLKGALPKGPPFHSGGGTTKLISRDWVIWATVPGRFEAGTPAIMNVIMFARALQLIRKYGKELFRESGTGDQTAEKILFCDDFGGLAGKSLLKEFRHTYIYRDNSVPSLNGNIRGINLDNSASTPTFGPIWEAFRKSFQIQESLKKDLIDRVKNICSDFLNAPEDRYEFLFCSNTTEAINLAAENLSLQQTDNNTVILSTMLEHSSNDLPWRTIPGSEVIRVNMDENGFVDLEELEGCLKEYNELKIYDRKRIQLLAISGASNVLGVCNDLNAISQIAHQYGAKLLVDAAQLIAHRKIDMSESDIDFLAFSGHKIYAPFGCGMLLAKKELLHFPPEELYEIKSSGEENMGGIAALGKALSLLGRIGMEVVEEEERALTTRLLDGMTEIPGMTVYGIRDTASTDINTKIGVVAFNLKNVISFKVGKELAGLSGIGIRVGCHCAHITVKKILNVSPRLERFQRVMQTIIPGITFPGVARVSLGLENSEEDVDLFIDTLGLIARQNIRK
jgi:selenocysteine lyase/cysteine desulfurase